MAQNFVLNGTTISRINKGDWDDTGLNRGLDANTPLNRWVRHVWSADVLTAAEFNTIYALEGQRVTLTTVNYSDRNGDYISYFGVVCGQVRGTHEGPVFTGVTAEFMVRL